MIDLTMDPIQRDKTAKLCGEKGILLPTFREMRNPDQVPAYIKDELKSIGLWDVHSRNLYRVTWENEPVSNGGGYTGVNYMEIPSELTGVKARIIALVGKWFPTGAHKVGASYGCLAPTLIAGHFDPVANKAVWPSTGNYCRGGAYISRLLGCESIAILPEEMSRERFDWLANIAGETIATPGCESNVKEIFDKCWELKGARGDSVYIFNQFDQEGNHLWHYEVTGPAMEKVLSKEMKDGDSVAGVCLSSGSAGTLGSAEYIKELYPYAKIGVSEALQCPTLLSNGFGGHRIEGIGDKHVPWIHNVRNTDMILAVDDEHTIRLIRLFNEPVGRKFLKDHGVDPQIVDNLDLLGISGVCNLITAIKFAKYYELAENDIVVTVFTDSMELYGSRLKELTEERGGYTEVQAGRDFEILQQLTTDNLLELSYTDRKRVHNLKYYTWIEQQAREIKDLNAQWYDRDYWKSIHRQVDKIDELILEFNEVVKRYS
ncbi:MAG: pyridoxal-5-phosphate-dependent protein subunit beta [Spirochaetales bacterium]|nr:pyridoxal-5-phosphate-dependent protein subunit beta [Spirochaetales bacterium]